MFWLLVGRLLSPFGLVDVLIISTILFILFISRFVVLIVVFDFYFLAGEIVRVENNIAAVIGILHLLYSLFLTLCINADYLV